MQEGYNVSKRKLTARCLHMRGRMRVREVVVCFERAAVVASFEKCEHHDVKDTLAGKGGLRLSGFAFSRIIASPCDLGRVTHLLIEAGQLHASGTASYPWEIGPITDVC